MHFPFYIARRYLISKSNQNAVNIINFVTFLVIVVGAAALFVVLSAFAGLKTFSLSFTHTFDPDIKAVPATGKYFSLSPKEESALQQVVGLAHYSKELEERAYFTFGAQSCIAYVKGIDTKYASVTGIDSTLYFGNWNLAETQAVIGRGIYNRLGMGAADNQKPITVLVPKPKKAGLLPQGLLSKPYKELPLTVSGVYAVEENLDQKYVFAPLPWVQGLLEKEATQISGLNMKIADTASEAEVQQAITAILGDKVVLLNRQQQNPTLYRMLNTENLVTYLVFTLVLTIALFNVVGALIMLILDKRQNAKTLFSLGATVRQIRRVYCIQGLLVTTTGGVAGILLGSLLVGSQLVWGWIRITPSLAYPVAYKPENVLIVLATIVVLGAIAAVTASSRVTKKYIAS